MRRTTTRTKTRILERLRPLHACLLAGGLVAAATAAAQPRPPATAAPRSEAAAAAEGSAATLGADASPRALRSARDALVEAGDFPAALDPARRLTRSAADAAPETRGNDLTVLGRIETELRDFDAAERTYLEAVDVIRKAEGEFAEALVGPYAGLGRSYIAAGRFKEAVVALTQARFISRRNLGLYNVAQTEVIDDLTTAYLGLGDTVQALGLQRERLENAERTFGAEDLRTLPYRYRLGAYYDESRLHSAARDEYRKISALAERQGDLNAQLRALRQLVSVELLLDSGDAAQRKLSDLLAKSPAADATERGLSLASLGDWATAHEQTEAARGYYTRAYSVLGAAGAEPERVFGAPRMIDFVAPLDAADRDTRGGAYRLGTIVVAFDVSADGRARNVHTAEADPKGVVDAAYEARIRATHFRPRLADGAPVATSGVQFTHAFRYPAPDG